MLGFNTWSEVRSVGWKESVEKFRSQTFTIPSPIPRERWVLQRLTGSSRGWGFINPLYLLYSQPAMSSTNDLSWWGYRSLILAWVIFHESGIKTEERVCISLVGTEVTEPNPQSNEKDLWSFSIILFFSSAYLRINAS